MTSPITPETLLVDAYGLYERVRLAGRSDSTKAQFAINLRRLNRFLGRPARVSDLTDETIGAMMGAMVSDGLAPRTANKLRDNLCALWRLLCERGFLQVWPSIRPIPEPERVPEAWTEEELALLFAACEQVPGRIGTVPASLWWTSLHWAGWDSGERISALVATQWDRIDMEEGWLLARAETRKGKRADKLFKLRPKTLDLLRQMRAAIPQSEPHVWPWPYHPTYLWFRYTKILERAGLPANRARKFHCLRKSVASHAARLGMDPTELLGHSSPKVTRKYLDPTIVQRPHAADVLPDIGEAELPRKPLAPSVPRPQEATPPTSGTNDLLRLLDEFASSHATRQWGRTKARRLERLFDDCGFDSLGQLSTDRIEGALGRMALKGFAPQTVDQHRSALRSFARWLVDSKGAGGAVVELLTALERTSTTKASKPPVPAKFPVDPVTLPEHLGLDLRELLEAFVAKVKANGKLAAEVYAGQIRAACLRAFEDAGCTTVGDLDPAALCDAIERQRGHLAAITVANNAGRLRRFLHWLATSRRIGPPVGPCLRALRQFSRREEPQNAKGGTP